MLVQTEVTQTKDRKVMRAIKNAIWQLNRRYTVCGTARFDETREEKNVSWRRIAAGRSDDGVICLHHYDGRCPMDCVSPVQSYNTFTV
jgi:hypothetical protein